MDSSLLGIGDEAGTDEDYGELLPSLIEIGRDGTDTTSDERLPVCTYRTLSTRERRIDCFALIYFRIPSRIRRQVCH